MNLNGTPNQIAWAEQIKTQVNAEFDRVAGALRAAASRQTSRNRRDTEAILEILEDKRAEVMAHHEAGYFIHNWQEMGDRVRKMIVKDDRHKAIKAGRL